MPPLSARNSLVSGRSPSVRTLRLSLVKPQPVALQRLNTGMRIISRMDGRPKTRTSPLWPPLKNT